jgi:hypothetical protein
VDVTLGQGDEPPEDIVDAEVTADCFEEKVPSDDVAEGESEPDEIADFTEDDWPVDVTLGAA